MHAAPQAQAAAIVVDAAWNAAATAQLLTSSGIFIVCVAAAIFLIASLPAVWALTSAAIRTVAVLKIVEKELPESAALLRLSGLEMTDCISEVTGLGSELSSGIRSSANLVTMAEQGVRGSIEGVRQGFVPLVARTEIAARSE